MSWWDRSGLFQNYIQYYFGFCFKETTLFAKKNVKNILFWIKTEKFLELILTKFHLG